MSFGMCKWDVNVISFFIVARIGNQSTELLIIASLYQMSSVKMGRSSDHPREVHEARKMRIGFQHSDAFRHGIKAEIEVLTGIVRL